MALQNKIFSLFISLAFSSFGGIAFAQQLADEPVGGMDENELEATEILLAPFHRRNTFDIEHPNIEQILHKLGYTVCPPLF